MTDIADQSPDRSRQSVRIRKILAFAVANPLFIFGGGILLVVFVGAVTSHWFAPYSPTEINMSDRLLAPNSEHWMGTDRFGRDIFSRILVGGQTSLTVGTCIVLLAVLIGCPIGLAAGYYGGRVDTVLMRFSDVFLAFPPLLLPIAITAAIGPGLWNAMIALAVSWFPWYARIMRGAVLRVRNELYVDAAQVMGVGDSKVMIRHIVPNSLTPIIVQASMDFGYVILAAASLSFIGLGARAPAIEWGLMAADSRLEFLDHWWTAFFPGMAIFVTVLAVNLIGDGLRDILDPKHGLRD